MVQVLYDRGNRTKNQAHGVIVHGVWKTPMHLVVGSRHITGGGTTRGQSPHGCHAMGWTVDSESGN